MLRVVHGHVGVAHQGGEVLAVLGEEGDADGAAHVQRQAVQRHRLGERRHHPVGPLAGLVGAGEPGYDDGELVAAEPRHQVLLADHLDQPGAHLDQQPVPHRVPERVVDVLEPVEVEQQQGQVGVRLAAGGPLGVQVHLLGHLGEQGLAVGQPGQRVEVGELFPLGGEPRHPVDREQRHQHQRDQRGAGPGGGHQHRGEQQQRAGGEQLVGQAEPDAGPPAVTEPQPDRGADQAVVDHEPGRRGAGHRRHVGPVQPAAVEEFARAEPGESVRGGQRARVLGPVEGGAPAGVAEPPAGDGHRHGLHGDGRAEPPAEQDGEGEAGRREDRRGLAPTGRHERAGVAGDGERRHGPERGRQVGQLVGERGQRPGRDQQGQDADHADEAEERPGPPGRDGVSRVAGLHRTSRDRPRRAPSHAVRQ
ncbi:hypothetical protein B0E53_05523 [Micromonospora sp. MH33]|nr:hypothetical protein B0E53_05523 [Micromonospora sp. MH33]